MLLCKWLIDRLKCEVDVPRLSKISQMGTFGRPMLFCCCLLRHELLLLDVLDAFFDELVAGGSRFA